MQRKFKEGDVAVIVDVQDWQTKPIYLFNNGDRVIIFEAESTKTTYWAGKCTNTRSAYFIEEQLEHEAVYNSPLYQALK